MRPDADLAQDLAARVTAASASRRALRPVGGDTKRFYGRDPPTEPLELRGHCGIVDYDPAELVVTVRAGTTLAALEAALAAHGQELGFEPLRTGPGATIGGAVAAGLAGPARPWRGAVRDHVLGARILDGRGRALAFGGRVIKNVAGYDLSRFMVGSLGCFGVLLELSLRTVPRVPCECTRVLESDLPEALRLFARARREPWPVTAAAHLDGRAWLRLQGGPRAVAAATAAIGGEDAGAGPWAALRELSEPMLSSQGDLWRLGVPPATPPLALEGQWLVDWGGALRWLRSAVPAPVLRAAVAAAGGTATLFRSGDPLAERWSPPAPALLAVLRRLKAALDPDAILSPGRLYADL